MFGYATNETPELMPMPIVLAHRLTRRLAEVRKKGLLSWIRPDGKSQVTVEYRNGRPVRVDTIVVSAQHSPDVTSKKIERDVIECVIKPVMPKDIFDPLSVKYHINPTGRFVVGGPMGDTGLTGRGIIDHLKLLRPIYKKTASYGHFGRNEPEFTWEKTDLAKALRREAGK